jgi:hypothetical protein
MRSITAHLPDLYALDCNLLRMGKQSGHVGISGKQQYWDHSRLGCEGTEILDL